MHLHMNFIFNIFQIITWMGFLINSRSILSYISVMVSILNQKHHDTWKQRSRQSGLTYKICEHQSVYMREDRETNLWHTNYRTAHPSLKIVTNILTMAGLPSKKKQSISIKDFYHWLSQVSAVKLWLKWVINCIKSEISST